MLLTEINGLDYDNLSKRVNGMEMIIKKILKSFVGSIPDNLASLKVAVESGDLEQIGFHAHTVKGVLQNIGAVESGELAKGIELSAKGGELAFAKDNYLQLIAMVEQLVADITVALG